MEPIQPFILMHEQIWNCEGVNPQATFDQCRERPGNIRSTLPSLGLTILKHIPGDSSESPSKAVPNYPDGESSMTHAWIDVSSFLIHFFCSSLLFLGVISHKLPCLKPPFQALISGGLPRLIYVALVCWSLTLCFLKHAAWKPPFLRVQVPFLESDAWPCRISQWCSRCGTWEEPGSISVAASVSLLCSSLTHVPLLGHLPLFAPHHCYSAWSTCWFFSRPPQWSGGRRKPHLALFFAQQSILQSSLL